MDSDNDCEPQPLRIAIPAGTQCSAPGCGQVYCGDPEEFTGEGWGLFPIERFAFCRRHSGTPDVLRAIRAPAKDPAR